MFFHAIFRFSVCFGDFSSQISMFEFSGVCLMSEIPLA